MVLSKKRGRCPTCGGQCSVIVSALDNVVSDSRVKRRLVTTIAPHKRRKGGRCPHSGQRLGWQIQADMWRKEG